MVAEQRLNEELLGPAHPVAHRADDRVLPDHDPHVAREEQVRERGQGVAGLVQRLCDRAGFLERAFDHEPDELPPGQLGELLRQHVRGNDFQGASDQKLPHVRASGELGQQGAHLVHFGEPLQHRDEVPVLPLRQLQIDDVVVEVFFPVRGRHRHELAARGMHENGPQWADFGGHTHPSHGAECNRVRNEECGVRSVSASVVRRTILP